ncbi:MAG: DUF4423 domain-containing protein [Myxococcales bacterium]|nr:DUF4423 domain-containing protein [Myxococcales bacterium]
MDFDRIAAEFMRALRGKRSQAALCRRLGYRSNVVYLWEAGRGFPTAARALSIARTVGIDVQASVRRFYVAAPGWLDEIDVATPEGVARLLADLKGTSRIVDLARDTGKTRFAIARWLKGQAAPRVNEFFHLVECASLRLLDLIETLVDPAALPSVRARWQSMGVARRLAYDAPWTQAVLRTLELDEYQRLVDPPPGWIAERIGITPDEEAHCLSLLERAGQVERAGSGFRPVDVIALDVRRDAQAAARARGFWGRVAAERAEAGHRGTVYTVSGVSAADLERLRELQKAYFSEVRAIIARSQPVERVVLTTAQMIDLTDGNESGPVSGS